MLLRTAARFPPDESPTSTILVGFTLYVCPKQYTAHIIA